LNAFDQTYRRRFFCGFNGQHGGGNQYRYRTLLRGTLAMARRTTGQASGLDSYPDPVTTASVIVNNTFTCNNTVTEIISSTSAKFFESSVNDFDAGIAVVNGAANWELGNADTWNANGTNSIANGVYSLPFYLVNASTLAANNRSFNANYRIWRVKKTL
jgi:hypothetical protein